MSWSTSPRAGRRRFSGNLVEAESARASAGSFRRPRASSLAKGGSCGSSNEQPGTSLSVYPIGVKFTDVDTQAVEDFMRDFGEEPPMESQQSSGTA